MPIRRSKWYGGGNRSMLANILIYGLLAILSSRLAFAIPNTLTLQGKLTNTAGGVLSGSYTMVFRIYDIPGFSYYNVSNQTGEDNTAIQNITYINYTNILWKDNRTVTTDANGIYDVVLHNLSLLNFSDQYYLGIMVGDDNESIPRINLTSSPYAFRANISEDLNKENRYEVSVLNITGNLTLGTDFDDTLTITTGRLNISDGSIKAAGNLTLAEKITFSLGQIIDNLVNGFLRISGNLNVTGNISIAQDTLFVDNTSGRVGIGTSIPGQKLTVIGNINATGNITSGTGTIILDATHDRIGIGTTQPTHALDVYGNVSIKGNLSVDSNMSVDGSTLFADALGNKVGIGTTMPYNELTVVGSAGVSGSLNASSINTTGSAYFATSSGRVGIGTTAPGRLLEVAGSINGTQLNISGAANLAYGSGMVGIGTTTPDNLLTAMGNELTSNAILHLNASDNFNTTVINVLTLDHVLKNPVNSTGGAGVSILFRASDNASQLANIGNISAILYNATNGSQLSALTFSTRTGDTGDGIFGHLTERMRIDGYGRVGINITKPTSTLHVVGNANITGRLDAGKLNITGVTFSQGDIDAAGSLRVAGGANISGDLGVSGKIGAGTLTPITTLDVKGKANFTGNFSVGQTSNIFFVDNTSGRVGIGTAGPAYPLQILGTIGIDSSEGVLSTISTDNSAATGPLNLRGTYITGTSSRGIHFKSGGSASDFSFQDSDGNVMLAIDETVGRVGIGTTSPQAPLHINASNAVIYLQDSDSAASNAIDYVSFRDSVGTEYGFVGDWSGNSDMYLGAQVGGIRLYESGGTSVKITGGNVGIGTTAPLSLLHLNKSDTENKSVTNVLTLDHTNPNGVNLTGGIGVSMLFRASDNASQIYNIGNISAILYNSTNGSQLGALTFSTVGADTGDNSFGHLTERLRIDGYGRVGINTTTPTKTLHVVGDANITGRLDAGKLNITGVSFSQGDLDAAGSLRVAGGTNISGDLGVLGKIGAGTLSPITALDVKGKANFTGNFSIMNASDTIFFVDNTSGRVGIGTASPGYSLTIGTASGGRMISGDVTVTDSSSSIYGAALIMRGSATSASNGNQILGGSLQSILAATNTQSWTATVGMRAVDAKVQMLTGASGTVTGGANFYARTAIDAGTLTNWYGTYIEAPTGAGTITNKYAFVSEAGAGNVGIGNTVPNASLDVTGNIFLSSASPIINVSGPTIRKSGSDIVISD